MIITLPQNLAMVSDSDVPDGELPEQPIIICLYSGDGSIGLIGWEGDSVSFPARMAKEIAKQILKYAKEGGQQ